MSILDDLAKAVSSGFSSQSSFSGAGYEIVWGQLKPFLATLTTNGVLKWVPRATMQMPCQVPEYVNGYPVGPCANHAVDTCIICKRPVCMSHAFVEGQRGDVVCYLCVANMRQGAAAPHTNPGGPKEQPKAGPPPKGEDKARSWWAHSIFGIQEGVSWNDVKKQYRTLSAQYHPDRSGGDEAKFKDVQKAYEILKALYGEN